MSSTQSFIVTAPRASQAAALRAAVLRLDPQARITHDLPIINGFSYEGSPLSRQALDRYQATDSGIRVHPDDAIDLPPLAPSTPRPVAGLDNVDATLQLDRLWSRGVRGKGVGVAVIDSGIADHPDLHGRITAFHDFTGMVQRPHDENGHGTHVAGIIAGNGKRSGGRATGIAPEASLIGLKVTDEMGHGKASDFIAAIQWAVDNKNRYNIRVMNLSFGHPVTTSWKEDPSVQAVEAAVAAGIVACVAAGNRGPDSATITAPGNAPSAITVGAIDDKGTPTPADDELARFSGRGPTAIDTLTKPDIAAPGVDIKSAHNRDDDYIEMSGTSMASPMVAGTAALLIGARPDLTPAQVKAILKDTAHALMGQGVYAQGAGIVSPVDAVAAALALPPTHAEGDS